MQKLVNKPFNKQLNDSHIFFLIPFSKLNGADKAVWDDPDMSKCVRTDSDFDDLENITVTAGKLLIWVFICDYLLKKTQAQLIQLASVSRQLTRHCGHD